MKTFRKTVTRQTGNRQTSYFHPCAITLQLETDRTWSNTSCLHLRRLLHVPRSKCFHPCFHACGGGPHQCCALCLHCSCSGPAAEPCLKGQCGSLCPPSCCLKPRLTGTISWGPCLPPAFAPAMCVSITVMSPAAECKQQVELMDNMMTQA